MVPECSLHVPECSLNIPECSLHVLECSLLISAEFSVSCFHRGMFFYPPLY
jgi:hypothetical protein